MRIKYISGLFFFLLSSSLLLFFRVPGAVVVPHWAPYEGVGIDVLSLKFAF